ncbi:MAG: FAD-dependent thymidylate synthase [Candidatus Nanoarchaeia archaeon]|nr:FAD-dependent thymidylate synthase [Candidatus Nanoarchaeia archaeon]MDD5357830.1 FAD-dependent thymidylate synthase [Candidatus Nanoarchaeia archaeon]MDD5588749.1 FAD-dependent thymidylate synthase [Candidatus Nanoarchaeia archaeon]
METKRLVVPVAEEILGREYSVLNKGFIRLVDYMGGDESIVQAARVAYGKGTKKVSEGRGLIRNLMRNEHTSPFEMVEFKWHCKMPIFVARQWIRHRTANVNEYSMRYSQPRDEFYIPALERVKFQSSSNKQGSGEEVPKDLALEFVDWVINTDDDSMKKYKKFSDENIARELVRIGLPLNTYTEWYWKCDLHNTLHFLKLRMAPEAQYEIREYANAMAGIIKQIVPLTYEAFDDYVLGGVRLSKQEIETMKKYGMKISANELEESNLSGGEQKEFLEKLKKFE